jgi:hypothetical protein
MREGEMLEKPVEQKYGFGETAAPPVAEVGPPRERNLTPGHHVEAHWRVMALRGITRTIGEPKGGV